MGDVATLVTFGVAGAAHVATIGYTPFLHSPMRKELLLRPLVQVLELVGHFFGGDSGKKVEKRSNVPLGFSCGAMMIPACCCPAASPW